MVESKSTYSSKYLNGYSELSRSVLSLKTLGKFPNSECQEALNAAPPDPEMRRPATRQSDRAKIANPTCKKQKQRYSISVETQAAFWILAPTFLMVALLAIGGRL